MNKRKGWFKESYRHSLASKGIKTKKQGMSDFYKKSYGKIKQRNPLSEDYKKAYKAKAQPFYKKLGDEYQKFWHIKSKSLRALGTLRLKEPIIRILKSEHYNGLPEEISANKEGSMSYGMTRIGGGGDVAIFIRDSNDQELNKKLTQASYKLPFPEY